MRSTAYHEAGHLVLAYRFGHYVGGVTIKPDHVEGYDGAASTEVVWADGSNASEHIIVLYAGYAAAKRLNPTAEPEGCGKDNDDAAEILESHPELSERELRQQTESLVAKYWPEIEAVAYALMETDTMEGDEATIICDAVEENEDWRAVLDEYRQRQSFFNEGGAS